MNKMERISLVKAMEFIARQCNDEEVFFYWLENGVADGDIKYNDTEYSPEMDDEELEYYVTDEHFSVLMDDFLRLMNAARKSGGLYCDGVVSMTETEFRKRQQKMEQLKQEVSE